MGLYNFQPRFVPMILDGSKTHTIRACRRHADVAGNTLHLYTGLRQKGARRLMVVACTLRQDIEIDTGGRIKIDGVELDRDERDALARNDGFESFVSMLEFWNGRRPFVGHIIHWEREWNNARVVRRSRRTTRV